MFSLFYPRLVKGLMGNFKVSGLNQWGGFGEIDQSSVNKLPFIPKRKLKKKDGVHSPEYLEVSQWKDMENRDYPKRKVLVSNLLHDREAVMLYSPTGVGKTWLSLSIAFIAAGKGRLEILDGQMMTHSLFVMWMERCLKKTFRKELSCLFHPLV